MSPKSVHAPRPLHGVSMLAILIHTFLLGSKASTVDRDSCLYLNNNNSDVVSQSGPQHPHIKVKHQ